MLEGRKLSLEMQGDKHSRLWTLMSLFIGLACITLLISIWISLAIAPPPPDQSQNNMAEAHAKVLKSIESLKANLSADQTIQPELYASLTEAMPRLTEFAQLAAQSTQAPAKLKASEEGQESQRADAWPGRVELILDDLNTLILAKESTLNLLLTRDALMALYKPKGSLLPQASVPLTAYRELSTAVTDWAKLTPAPIKADNATNATHAPKSSSLAAPVNVTLTWALLDSSRPAWRLINAQLDALEAEAKQTDNAAQAKPAQLLLTALNQNNLMQSIRNTDEPLTKVWTARERLLTSLENLPPVPQVIVAPPPFSWSELAFPGKPEEGLKGVLALLVIGLAVLLAAHVSKQRHLQVMSQKWLALMRQLENTLREVTQSLTASVNQQDELIAELNRLLEQSKVMQQTLSKPSETPEKTLEDQAWRTAARMQDDLESELLLLREKLLNIHLQFCSGATHENLVYDLAFTAEGIQTVLTTASDLGRSFAILKEHLHQTDTTGQDPEVAAVISQISNLRNSVKRMTQNIRELSSKLQVAVEDVPDGKRFDSVQSPYASRGGYGNPPV